LLKNCGFFAESGKFFVIVSYVNLIRWIKPINANNLKNAVYFYPKYRFFNILKNHSLIVKPYVVFYSLLITEFKIVFKYLRTFNHFWFYLFLFRLFPVNYLKKFVHLHFNYLLFSKTFHQNSSPTFLYFLKNIAKENLFSLMFTMLKQRFQDRLKKRLKK